MSSKNVILKKKVGNTIYDINPKTLASLVTTNNTVGSTTYTDLDSLLTNILTRLAQAESDIATCDPTAISTLSGQLTTLQGIVGVHSDNTDPQNPVTATGLCAASESLQTLVGVHADDTANPAIVASGLCADVEGIQASLNTAVSDTTGTNIKTKLNLINTNLTISSS